jgi:DNA invertase Pin-like site-specific DNA recombinase
MLAYLLQERVDYVIVHKVDRLARNRVDDIQIDLAIRKSGARLVSCMENIDETPSGALLHGIMSSIAEFYSRNLAGEVMKGNLQKVKGGGSVGRAPIGYSNVRRIVGGQEIRTVEVDPERAPFVIWAFQQYATGEWTTRTLHAEVTRRGLVSRATAKCPEKPLVLAAFNNMLKNPYLHRCSALHGCRVRRETPALDRQGHV